MIAEIVKGIVSAILSALFGFAQQRRTEEAQREAGAAETASSINKDSADAQRRAADAAINTPHGNSLDDDLESGRRQF